MSESLQKGITSSRVNRDDKSSINYCESFIRQMHAPVRKEQVEGPLFAQPTLNLHRVGTTRKKPDGGTSFARSRKLDPDAQKQGSRSAHTHTQPSRLIGRAPKRFRAESTSISPYNIPIAHSECERNTRTAFPVNLHPINLRGRALNPCTSAYLCAAATLLDLFIAVSN
jgi:hypothetical protein